MTGVLDGIRVVEIGAMIAGPSAAAMLGDWGAQVSRWNRSRVTRSAATS